MYLKHHGIRGQKWGVRRYQNKDGSLTPAGRVKREKLRIKYNDIDSGNANPKYYHKDGSVNMKGSAAKAKIDNEYRELTNGKTLQRNDITNFTRHTQIAKNDKPIRKMTNKEIQDKIDRINLERKLSDLMKKNDYDNQKSFGEEYVKRYMKKTLNKLADEAVNIGVKYLSNKIKKELFDSENRKRGR